MAQSAMTDEQIMTFIAKEKANNTSRSLIVTKLIEKGVDIQRIRAIRSKYEKQKNSEVMGAKNISGIDDQTEGRLRHNNVDSKKTQRKNKNFNQRDDDEVEDNESTEYQKLRNKRKQIRTIDKELDFIMPDSLAREDDEEEEIKVKIPKEKGKKVFGRDIFSDTHLTFEPELNIATPIDYRLGAGDAVFVDVWEASQKQYTATVSP